MAGERRPEDLAEALARMARGLLAKDSLQDTLDAIVAYAVELVDGCEGAGIMVIRKRRVRTLAVSDDRMRESDRFQGELGEGPCFDAIRTNMDSYLIPDLSKEAGRWRRYVPRARELGIHSMLGFKLFTEEETLGALNLFSTRTGALTEWSERTGWLLASHAAVAFASARSDADLQGAISTRQDIGVAMGILMERYSISADEAFATLAKASQDHNLKLREVARRVAETGADPVRAAREE